MKMRAQSQALLTGLGIQHCPELWCRSQMCGLDPALLWLWHRLAAAAPIPHLAWELPYAMGAANKKKKKNPYYYLLLSLSPFSFVNSCLIHILRCFYVGCVNIYKYYNLLTPLSLYNDFCLILRSLAYRLFCLI